MVGALRVSRGQPYLVGALVILGAVAVGVVVSAEPAWGATLIGSFIGFYAVTRHAFIRSVAVISGGLAFLWHSSDISVEKIIYLAVILVACGLGLNNIAHNWHRAQEIGARWLLVAACAVGTMLGLSAIVALWNGIALAAWALDTTAYWMLVAAIVIGLDLGVSGVASRYVGLLLLVAGLATAAGYTLVWWDRRHLADSPIAHLLFPSMFLAGAAFSLAVARAFAGKQPFVMGFLAAFLAGAIFIAGTRAAILFLVPVAVILATYRRQDRWRLVKFGLAGSATLIALWSVVGLLAETGSLDIETVNQRLANTVPLILSGDVSLDPSLYGRSIETSILYQAWSGSPWFGVGPGHRYVLLIPGQSPEFYSLLVDSPLVPLARFGLVGFASLFALLAALAFGRVRRGATTIPGVALFAFVCMVFAWALVSSPLDDKGVALGLIPLIGLAALERRTRDPVEGRA